MAELAPEEVAAFAHTAGFSGANLPTAVAIAFAESGGKTNATNSNSNGTHDWGLFQINDVHKPNDSQKTDPLLNAQMAYQIYQQAGNSFKPWSTYNSGSYKKYTNKANDGIARLKKEGSAEERRIVAGHATVTDTPNLVPGADKLSNVPSAITGAVNGISSKITDLAISGGVLVVGIAVIGLGVMLVLRKEGIKVGATVAKALI